MPELPEVETVVQSIRDGLINNEFEHIDIRWPKVLFNFSEDEFLNNLVKRKIQRVERRAKFIIIGFNEDILAIHLRMTGKLYFQNNIPQNKHISAIIKINNGNYLIFEDTRKFGRFYYYQSQDYLNNKLGIEPLSNEMNGRILLNILHSKKRIIKALLLDQHIIAGLGNIYVDECLWKSNIHPETISNKIPEKNITILSKMIKSTLQSSIKAKGTTVVDFTFLNGRSGKYSDQLNIFRKEGNPCPKCSEIIIKKKVAGRGTHFCPNCQVIEY
tara:strand:+ start:5749 stop:6564 length:816 start_codon:yes stop_codon:yes gene_type:complete